MFKLLSAMLPHALFPLSTRLHHRLGYSKKYQANAVRNWVICPEVTESLRPSIFVSEDLSRVSGVFPGETIAGEIEKAVATQATHRATKAYELRDAVMVQGHLFTAKAIHKISRQPIPLVARGIQREQDSAVLASTRWGHLFFGHWMTDDLTLTLAAQDLGNAVGHSDNLTPQQNQYLDGLNLRLPEADSTTYRKITILDDYGQNHYKRSRHSRLRDIAASVVRSTRHRGVMLLRGDSGERRVLVNESEVADEARRRGFAVLDPRDHTATEMIEACLDAKLVLGVEGSQMAHGAMWMSSDGTLLELQPPNRFNVHFKQTCDCRGLQYAFMVGHPADGGFSCDLNALKRLLDRLDHG